MHILILKLNLEANSTKTYQDFTSKRKENKKTVEKAYKKGKKVKVLLNHPWKDSFNTISIISSALLKQAFLVCPRGHVLLGFFMSGFSLRRITFPGNSSSFLIFPYPDNIGGTKPASYSQLLRPEPNKRIKQNATSGTVPSNKNSKYRLDHSICGTTFPLARDATHWNAT